MYQRAAPSAHPRSSPRSPRSLMPAPLCVLRLSPAPLSSNSQPDSPLHPSTMRIPRKTPRRTPTLTLTLTSRPSLPAALAPAPRLPSPALPLAAHASATVSPAPAPASSSTVVAPAAATPTPLSAPPSPRTKSKYSAPPAAKVSSSASRSYLPPSCSDQSAVSTANGVHAREDNIAEIRTQPTLVARSFHFPPIVWLIFCHWSCSFPDTARPAAGLLAFVSRSLRTRLCALHAC